MYIPTLVFMKPVDGFSSFLNIFLFVHHSNCAKRAVLVLFFCAFLCVCFNARGHKASQWIVLTFAQILAYAPH